MPSALPTPDACCPTCPDETTVNIPGTPGHDGTDGTNGTNGTNGHGITIYDQAGDPGAAVEGDIWITATDVKIKKADLSWQSIKGNAGPSASLLLTTKGDVLTYSTVATRMAIGSDGKSLVADSSQATGNKWSTITPNAATDNGIPRFDGASGTPLPLQSSSVVITDTGAVQASGSGGNARGVSAVDLQTVRAAVTQVASGLEAGIVAGHDNTASGAQAFVGAGHNNLASGSNATIPGGTSNSASATNSTVGGGGTNVASQTGATVGGGQSNSATSSAATVAGGGSNTASGASSVVAGGTSNAASAQYASIGGGLSNSASGAYSAVTGGWLAVADKHGQIAHAAGQFVAPGDAQASRLVARNNTTDATSTTLFLDGSSLKLVVPINTAWAFTGMVIGRTSAGVCGLYQISGGIKNNAGVTSLIGAVTVAAVVGDGAWPGGASVAVTADVAGNALKIAAVCAIATLCRWVASLDLVEVGY